MYRVPPSADHFALLGLPRSYAIDQDKLSAAYRAIARNVHPDCFAGEPTEVATLATSLSAALNQALNVLTRPVERAEYMLELAGGPSAAELREVPGNLLAEVMMLREGIEEARVAGDSKALQRLRQDLLARRAERMAEVARQADTLATARADQRKTFRLLLNSIKYYDNLLGELTVDPLERDAASADGQS